MTIADVCKVHKVSGRTVRRWIADGRLPAMIIDGVMHVSSRRAEDVAGEWRSAQGTRRARPRGLDLTAT